MKKLLIVMLLLMFSTSAFAGFLTDQWTKGVNRYCRYTDGTIVTISVTTLCPLSN